MTHQFSLAPSPHLVLTSLWVGLRYHQVTAECLQAGVGRLSPFTYLTPLRDATSWSCFLL